jgi:hypothetical protein
MDREISAKALVAAVRYGTYEEDQVWWERQGPRLVRWIRVMAVRRSKRRFHNRANLEDIVHIMQADQGRYALWQCWASDEWWVKAL